MTESMIERVAKVLCRQDGVDPSALQGAWQAYTVQAQELIEAMREPTARMVAAGAMGSGEDSETVASSAWGSMIDAALQWPPGSADRAGVPMARD